MPAAAKTLAPKVIHLVVCGGGQDNTNPAGPRRVGLPFRDSSYDVVLSRHKAFEPSDVRRVLKPGGVFVTQQVGADETASGEERPASTFTDIAALMCHRVNLGGRPTRKRSRQLGTAKCLVGFAHALHKPAPPSCREWSRVHPRVVRFGRDHSRDKGGRRPAIRSGPARGLPVPWRSGADGQHHTNLTESFQDRETGTRVVLGVRMGIAGSTFDWGDRGRV